MRRVLYCTLLLGFLFPSQSVRLVAQTSKAAKTANVSYEQDVRPIFKTHCFQCHGESNVIEGGLDLRLNRFIQKGGDNGPATIAGDHKKSLIWQRVSSGAMPPEDNNLSPFNWAQRTSTANLNRSTTTRISHKRNSSFGPFNPSRDRPYRESTMQHSRALPLTILSNNACKTPTCPRRLLPIRRHCCDV